MSTDLRAQVIAMADSGFVRDAYVNTLHFQHTEAGPFEGIDAEALAEDLAEIFRDFWYAASREITVKLYEVGPPPQFPIATKTLNAGSFTASPGPRELALCLSFYSEHNTPRTRGRIFLPAFAGGASNSLRPNSTIMNKALLLGEKFAALGGLNVDWKIWSPTDNAMKGVTHCWVDDEWDVVRSRGLRPTTRVTSSPGQ